MKRLRLGFATLLLLLAATMPALATPTELPEQLVVTPDNFSTLTQQELAAAGITPGMRAPNGDQPEVRILPKGRNSDGGGPSIQSAFGCNKSVCIGLTGQGLIVDKWETWADGDLPTCTFAAYWANGQVIATSNEVCGGVNAQYYSWWNQPGMFADGTQACNTWVNIAGKPCKTIHA